MRVLIIEDHEDVAANIGDYLEARGHEADFASDGLGGLHLAVTNDYDVIVLRVVGGHHRPWPCLQVLLEKTGQRPAQVEGGALAL